jgi:dihydroorotate dehydrogenase
MSNSVLLPHYDRSRTYLWNYDNPPHPPANVETPPVPGNWTYCGRPVPSPLGIAAGPLLNGRWILYYAALGFDVLTYKTTRSRQRECYPLPNLQPVSCGALADSQRDLATADEMQGSWAVSFGMPSRRPEIWRADVEWTRRQLSSEKLLAVSVVASPEPGWSLDELAADYAQCARWAVERGADCVETNFSCPNVSTADGQLYQQPEASGIVAQRVREAIGATPYVIKIGFVNDHDAAAALLDAVAPFADALSMTNCIAAMVHDASGKQLFGGQPRGIGGDAIRAASIAQVGLFSSLAKQRGYSTKIIGVGGISQADHVRQYLASGAEAVHLATSVMLQPTVAIKIRQQLGRPR